MALIPLTLQTKITAIFDAMNNITEGGDEYCAAEMASAIKAYILTGQATTIDSGAAPAGAYAGAGVGVMTIKDSALNDDLLPTFAAGYDNDGLADHMASDIDAACAEDDTVQETSTGTVTTGSGATVPFSGPAVGKLTGTKTLIATALKACFQSMSDMTSGGNQLFAEQLSTALDAYLKAGAITVQLKPPFSSGSGSGKIA
jgi:hypothetical protein